jgi:uncharacterized protein
VRRSLDTRWGWPPGLRTSSPLLRWLLVIAFAHGLLNCLYAVLLRSWPVLAWTADLLGFVVVPLVLVGAAIERRQVTPTGLGFRSTTNDRHGRLVLIIMLVSVPFASILVYALDLRIGYLLVPGSRPLMEAGWSSLMPPSGPLRTLLIFYLSVTAGLTEELIYRAVLFRIVSPRVAYSWRYLALSALLFGLIHWGQGPAGIVATGLFGAYLALLYRSSGNLWPSIVGHTAVDLFVLSALGRHA